MAFGLKINRKVKIAIVTVCRLLLGISFVIFGFLRACNPVAGAYMVDKYLNAAGLGFFTPVSGLLTVFFAAAEFAIGICSLLGTNIKKTSLYTALLIGFLTPFSFYTTYFAQIQGGSGIGDGAINGASCWTYLLYLIIAILIFIWRDYSKTLFTNRTEWAIGPLCIVFSLCVSIISYFKLPMIDLTPYRTGISMRHYEASKPLTQKDVSWDEKGHFSVNQMERVTTSKGKRIEAFQVYDQKKGDITKSLLSDKGYTFLLIAEDLSTTSTDARHHINDLYDYCRDNGYKFYCLTTTNPEASATEEYVVESGGAEYPFVNADARVLKLMIQSKPGLMLIKDGVIYRKWSNYEIPAFKDKLENCKEAGLQLQSMRMKVFLLFLKLAALLAAILALDWFIGLMKWFWRKKVKKGGEKKAESNAPQNLTKEEIHSEDSAAQSFTSSGSAEQKSE